MEQLIKDRIEEMDLIVGDESENTQANKFLLFEIGEEIYGIGIASVTEIIEMQRITEVPDLPEYVKGVINLRGRVIPVIDLRLRFEMTEREWDDRTCMIIVRIDDTSMGLIVDTVAEVQDILEQDIEPPPSFKENEEQNRYISGLGKVGDEVKILLDDPKILKEQDLEIIKQGI